MKKPVFFILVIAILCFIRCDNDNNVGPEERDPIPNVGTYVILPHGVITSPPHEVHLFCNVIDTSRTAVDFLTDNRFIIRENGTAIDQKKAAVLVRKRNMFDYHLNTVLLLDVSTGTILDDLKEAARAFVNDIDPMQSIAVYTFSSTLSRVHDFTQDSGQLINAINGMTAGSAERNLYGAVLQGFNLYSEIYNLGTVQQGNLVVFTAGNDTKNEKDKDEVIYTSQFTNVYIIGFGRDLDRDFLNQTGNRRYCIVTEANQLSEAFTQTQASITKFADSFYWISYQSSLRGTETQIVEMSISANAYNGPGCTMNNSFNTNQFEDSETGMTVNWTPAEPAGVDTLIIGVNMPRTVMALSQGGDVSPVYEWSSEDPGIMTVTPVTEGFPEAVLFAGTEGNTLLIVNDTANGFTRTVLIKAVQSYNRFVLREWWKDITGSSINALTSDPRFPDFPSGREYITQMEGAQNFGDNYSSRLRGFVCPDVSGTYSFWIASDDASQLYFSINENPESKAVIARVDNWTGSRSYEEYSSQHSADIELEAGKCYYIEVLHKEGGGGDNVSVAWQGPGIDRSLIPSENLSAWLGD
ncbi:VWA domain-containing protein [bacterium]|nr:VWA domain-containing protein [bacterium]